eukprot:1530733-Prymnesium_polylepis.2
MHVLSPRSGGAVFAAASTTVLSAVSSVCTWTDWATVQPEQPANHTTLTRGLRETDGSSSYESTRFRSHALT